MRIKCDNEKCVGCLACVATCLDHHYPADEADATPLRRYKKYTAPSGLTKFVTYSCYHCSNAPCIAACPVHAIVRKDDGRVLVNKELCIGCGSCKDACPFDIPVIDANGKMVKCDLCGGDPSCVKICPMNALTIV